MKNRLVPMNNHNTRGRTCWEIDGISIKLLEHKDKPVNRGSVGLKVLIQQNTESRIRTIHKRKDKLWITLYHDLSEFKAPICQILNDYIANLKKHYKKAYIDQIDFKIDSYGSFQVQNV
jgi:hypothetical protein